MTEIIGVRFKSGGKMYYFNPNSIHVDVGQHVVIETSKGIEFGECVQSNTMVDEMELVSTLRPMLRIATREDFEQIEANKEREKRAYAVCQEKIVEHQLEMKLVDVKYSFDGSKVLFFFTADGRVDFRGLVKDLAAIFRTRIELRQIGVRDEAKMMGGLGICGRPFCCAQFLDDFQPVSIKMAKTQNISLNPTKISGACGRLMCCLKYEQDAYEDLLKRTPKLESLVRTPDGIGTVNAVSLLREQSKIILDNDPDTPHVYHNSELEIIRSGKGKRPAGYELPEQEEKPRPQRTEPKSAPKPKPVPAPVAEEVSAPVEEVVVEAAAPVAEPKAEEEKAARRPRRKRPQRPAPSAPQGEAPAQQPQKAEGEAAPQQKKERPQRRPRPQRAAAPAGEGQPQKQRPPKAPQNAAEGEKAEGQQRSGGHRRHRPHHHHRGNGGAPKSE